MVILELVDISFRCMIKLPMVVCDNFHKILAYTE